MNKIKYMYVKIDNTPLLNVWEDTPENRFKAERWKFEIYTGETETGYDGHVYVKGEVPAEPKRSYIELRQESYPQITEYIDAQVKLASDDPIMREAGKKQLEAYLLECLAVKEKYPKETTDA